MDVKVILISQYPLPYNKIGSWTKMYNNYISESKNQIDLIICPELTKDYYEKTEYIIYKKPKYYKLKSKLTGNRFFYITNVLLKYINQHSKSKFIIQIVDNFGLLKSLCKLIIDNKLKEKVYIQYFYHGFTFNSNKNDIKETISKVDELILLTNLSKNSILKQLKVLPPRIKILHNGIETPLFNSKKRENDIHKIIFLWCSQDRPKKGLSTILNIWDAFYQKHQNTELWVVGTYNEIKGSGITSFGRVENNKLPDVYKKADVYLFPTLCLEGFGLTLAEALHCGCFCIASNLGGVPEVLNFGEYGWLIDNPENPKNWYNAMTKFMLEKPIPIPIPKDLYSFKNWSSNMNKIIDEAKLRLEKKVETY